MVETNSATELGLNDHHHVQLTNYLRFARYQRNQRLRAIEYCFENQKRQLEEETTYTRDEVLEMLKGLLEIVKGDTESELINSAHTTLLLLRQMCVQAEKWHLKLNADISELENRELLDAVLAFEQNEFSLDKSSDAVALLNRLEPAENGPAGLLQAEIDRLNRDNLALRQKLEALEAEPKRGIELNAQLGEQSNAKPICEASELFSIQQNRAMLEQQQHLSSAQQQLIEIQSQLSITTKELEKKFGQTAVYQNMKKMLEKKNNQIKELRSQLGGSSVDADDD